MIIALDGPAGAGKSTVARRVAKALGLTFLDTGAMYRAVTLVVLERGIHPSDAEACGRVARDVHLDFDPLGEIRIDGRAGEPDIRSRTVTLNVSAVSAHQEVREVIVRRQREIAGRLGGVVAEGRDTTTVVFPTADHKFFLIASPEVRAERRALQEGSQGRVGEILADIQRRDKLDTTRAHGPLTCPGDAVVIDADRMTVDEVVAAVLEHVRGRSTQR